MYPHPNMMHWTKDVSLLIALVLVTMDNIVMFSGKYGLFFLIIINSKLRVFKKHIFVDSS